MIDSDFSKKEDTMLYSALIARQWLNSNPQKTLRHWRVRKFETPLEKMDERVDEALTLEADWDGAGSPEKVVGMIEYPLYSGMGGVKLLRHMRCCREAELDFDDAAIREDFPISKEPYSAWERAYVERYMRRGLVFCIEVFEGDAWSIEPIPYPWKASYPEAVIKERRQFWMDFYEPVYPLHSEARNALTKQLYPFYQRCSHDGYAPSDFVEEDALVKTRNPMPHTFVPQSDE